LTPGSTSTEPLTQAHEALCKRCGRCCYHKLIVGEVIIAMDDACQYLDTSTKVCSIYDKRFEMNPRCLSVAQGIRKRVFPNDCPYVAHLKHYQGPLYGLSKREIEDIINSR